MTRWIGRNDFELLLVVLFWALNISIVKGCLSEMEPLAFNIIRFGFAALMLIVLTWRLEGSLGVARADLGRVILLGALGHTAYQLFFVMGLARTTASSTALIFGTTPVVVTILSRIAGHEKPRLSDAAGALLAFYGVYRLVGASAPATAPEVEVRRHLTGDLLLLGAVVCWSAYTVLARSLLARYSPLKLTAVTLSLGAALLIPASVPDLLRQDWSRVSAGSWAGLVYSFLFALVISYIIWYRSVRQVGNVRTAIYANLVPVFGAFFGVMLLGDTITPGLGVGALCIFGGILLTRFGPGGRAGGRSASAMRPPPRAANREPLA
ncbi:MAG TPA: DMT family transporter [Candidatus Polarisedimenticolia bacterium]|nr:DMT family transporter [Candidatus Polarisedimenticolia bacterium]